MNDQLISKIQLLKETLVAYKEENPEEYARVEAQLQQELSGLFDN